MLSTISNKSNKLTPSKYNFVYWFAMYSGEFNPEINSPMNCFFSKLNASSSFSCPWLFSISVKSNAFNLSGYCVALVITEKLYVGYNTN